MPRMSKKRRLEWAFFLNERNRITFNALCRGCTHDCNFTFDEINLMCIYNTGTRAGLMQALTDMRGQLEPDEAELLELTDSALRKLGRITDEQFAELELVPDFD